VSRCRSASPWRFCFELAGTLSPAALVDLARQQTGLTGIPLDLAVWSTVTVVVLVLALLLALLVRPSHGGRRSST
jgi:hypothetical protein